MLALDAGKPAPDSARAATPLSEIAASFKIKGPLLVVDKLTARNEALSLSGTGELRYTSGGQMNLLLDTRATGNDKTLAALRNRRISLHAQGRLMLPQVRVETSTTPSATPQPAMVSR
jgi:hypothetical protein